MHRRLALGLAWGLVTWNGLSLLGFVTGVALAPMAAPCGLAVGSVVAIFARSPRAAEAASHTLELDSRQA
jgi:hypothetical protein